MARKCRALSSSPSPVQKSFDEAKRLYKELFAYVGTTFDRLSTDNILNMDALADRIRSSADHLRDTPSDLLRFDDFGIEGPNYLVPYSLNTAILAPSVGQQLKLPTHQLTELGSAALLHDMEILKLPDAVYQHAGQIAENHKKAVMMHPVLATSSCGACRWRTESRW